MKSYFHSTADGAYPWTEEGGFYFRGYVLTENAALSGKEAIDHLQPLFESKEYSHILRSLNGNWSLIWDTGDKIVYAVDRLRSLPLFYRVKDNELHIGDDAEALVEALGDWTISRLSVDEFLTTRLYVTGPDTMLSELKQTQAGEFCIFDKATSAVERSFYFAIEFGDCYSADDLSGMRSGFRENYKRVGKDMVRALRGRTAVVPLSGGADSRMIATCLKNQGYEKVVCFTYGRMGNEESKISKMVAESLGYPWIMVPYDNKVWEDIRGTKELNAYLHYGSAYVSNPHLQDFAAVKYLKEHQMLPEDSVFIPGHSGDLIAGSHIDRAYLDKNLSHNSFLKTFTGRFYNSSIKRKKNVESKLSAFLNTQDLSTVDKMEIISESFNIQNRQAKFIVNSCRIYEFWGYEWLTPLWYNEQFDFWQRVPLQWRFQRKLYFYCINDTTPSTNDQTVGKGFANFVRHLPVVRSVCRKATVLGRYWNSPLRIERLFGFKEYFCRALATSSSSINNELNARRIVEALKSEIDNPKSRHGKCKLED